MLRRRCGTLLSGISLMLRPATQTAPVLGRSWRFIMPQQRALAGTRRADEEHELALGDVEAGVAERDDLGRVALGDVLESDHGYSPDGPAKGTAGQSATRAPGRSRMHSCRVALARRMRR